ncbi:hypothetical protein WJX75_004975 [Coccomyxa subellipsoidea]|uniref:Calponin-homology (CH) domain-containing protein n=1 Tax=Coccomyxa subellipsoidea TaxID=248742 RepID=A0ABR2YHZ7_9CHLO
MLPTTAVSLSVLHLLWNSAETLQVVLAGTAMAGSTTTVTSKSAGEASSVRPGLRPSERSVEGVMNAARPAGKLRLLSRATQPSAEQREQSSQAVIGVRTEPAGHVSASENAKLPAGKAAAAVRPPRPRAGGSAWPENDVSARKTFSFAHKGLWLEKQEKAFGVWLNAALAPPPPGGPEGGDDGGLAAKRLEARVRGALWHLYCGDPELIHVMTRVEKRIDEGFLRLKSEEVQMGDMRTKAQVAEVLSAYHPFWLRLGLEIVVGKPVPKQAAGSGRAELDAFAREHFLGDADLALQRAGNRAIKGLHSADYWVELGQLVLKRFLLLALLLDRAVAGPKPCPKGAPLLFRRGQPTKSSAQAVEKFLRGRMRGEGDVMRHLASLGLRLGYEQDPRTEFEFGIDSLAADLRSGVRLLRLTELLTGEVGLVQSCHFPAERRSLQLQNAQRSFAALSARDAAGIKRHRPEALVDGDREATLSFLATILLHFQLPAVLEHRALVGEIARIQAMAPPHDGGRGPASHPVWPASTGKPKCAAEASAQLLELLLRWARTVCGRSGIAMRELAAGSFADGRALCCIVNFYMPWLLPAARICQVPEPAAVEEEDSESHFQRSPWIAVLDEGEQAGPRRAATHRNFELLTAAGARLGGIPPILTADDCCAPGGPHEHAVIGYVAFLCARLLEVSCEERAAHTVQRHWRLSRTRRAGGARAHLHAWIEAARDIQAAWRARRFRSRLAAGPARRAALMHAVVRLQALWRGRAPRQLFLQQRAAVVLLQAVVRGWRDRRWVLNHITIPAILQRCLEARQALITLRLNAYMGRHATRAQAIRRGSVQRRTFLSQRAAAVHLQAAWRASIAAWRCHAQRSRFVAFRSSVVAVQSVVRGRAARRRFLALRQATITAQKLWRGRCVRRMLCTQKAAATLIQACWRRHVQRERYVQLRAATVCIQAHHRKHRAQTHFKRVRWAAAVIQKHHRGWSVRQKIARQHAAATRLQAKAAAIGIQRFARGAQARGSYAALRGAAFAIQARWRGVKLRRSFLRDRARIVAVQAVVRRHLARSRFLALRSAAVSLQAHWRGRQVRQNVACQRSAALTLQKHWRAARLRRAFHADVARIVTAQAAVRRWMAQRRFLQLRAAATALQAAWRGRHARLQARRIRATIVLQAHIRGWAVRSALARQRRMAVCIQSAWRGALARRQYRGDRGRIIACQAVARRWLAVARYRGIRRAAVAVQAAWRGRAGRRLAARIRAAVTLQRHARGWAVRQQIAHQAAAAVNIQAAWRGCAQRTAFLAHVRCIMRIQAAWRGRQERAMFVGLRAAAVVVQSAWRANRARRLRRRILAAICIQRYVRGHLLRKDMARKTFAAVVIQAAVRMHLQRNKFLAMVAMQRAMKEMYRTARRFARRTAASVKIQALARGFLARCEFRRRLAAKREREAAAMRVIAPWARTALERCRFLTLRRATLVIQRAYRRRHAGRTAAAAAVQTATRRYLAQKQYKRLQHSAICIQARWRGARQRRRAGKPAAAARRRLIRTLQMEVPPHATLAARTAAALHTLQQSFHLSQVMAAAKDLQHCVYLSAACAETFVNAGGASSVIHYMRSCNRSAPHMGLLRDGLSALGHAARRHSLALAVYAAEDAGVDCPSLMTAVMLQHRDNEEVYMAATAILLGAVGCPERAARLGANGQTVKQLESLGQLLTRKLDMESKYLNRLEGAKGSDVSAREATRKMVAARRQLVSLHRILTAIPGAVPSKELSAAAAEAHEGLAHAPRNTIVRDVLKNLHR